MKWEELASEDRINKTVEKLKAHNFKVEVVDSGKGALERIKELIPSGVDLMTAGSTTLQQIGFTDLLKSGDHKWINWKDKIIGVKNTEKANKLRAESTLATYFIGSAHAVTEDGDVLVASATGSQLAPYAYSSPNIILVVGTQKIVKDIEDGLTRIKEYSFQKEDARMKAMGAPGSAIGEILIMKQIILPNRTVHILLVKELLGF
jgi:hypothetical protein